MDTRIRIRLQGVARRLRSLQLGWSLAAVWALAAILGLALLHFGAAFEQLPWTWAICTAGITGLTWLRIARRWREPLQVAQHIESYFPSLKESLITAIDIRPKPTGQLGYLQRRVIAAAIRHDVVYRWRSTVSPFGLCFAWLANVPSVVFMLIVASMLWNTPHTNSPQNPASSGRGLSRQEPEVLPGDTEIERGTSLIVTARFDGELPDEVWLVRTTPTAKTQKNHSLAPENTPLETSSPETVRVAMRQSLKDPVFAAYVYDVREVTEYQIEYEQTATRSYRVDVFDYPTMVRADAVLEFPEYAQRKTKTVVDTRRLSAPAGTQLTWQLHLNKPVQSARLLADDDQRLDLQNSSTDPHLWEATVDVQQSTQWKLELLDEAGRTNQEEVTLRVRVLPNQEAKIRLTAGGDALVSPLEEFEIRADIADDFNVTTAGIAYQFNGEMVEIESSPTGKSAGTIKLAESISLEDLQAEPHQLIAYYVWAEDLDTENQPRRAMSDMFFAEVRPFDEIYRQGQQPSEAQQQSQQPQGNQQTQELLELQKQIVVGTWNVIRKHQGHVDRFPDPILSDIELLSESQVQAMQLLQEKAAEENAAEAQQIIAGAEESMNNAVERLEAAMVGSKPQDLSKALSHEQAAYQQLLQLQSREHEVTRSRRSQSSQRSSRSQNRQQQIDQLELDNEENRYEEERLAQDQQSREQAELRQVISRLRELAARQEDINDQLRELEAALQTAETPKEEEELRRRLERLREQQQQLLQDADELQERMESQAGEAMQDASDQMAETRESIQKSSEALRQNDTNQALAAGTRAEEELKTLNDEVRQQAANLFAETMESMQQQATDLEKRQEEIVQEFDSPSDEEESTGLRTEIQGPDLEDKLAKQNEQLQELLDQMQQTVADSEDAEPLLAQKLYESYRRTQQLRAQERLELTEQLLNRNLEPQARELAGQSIEDLAMLREDIDEAAESVLGSQVNSLRLALNQLDQLTEQLDREILEANGEPAADKTSENPGAEPRPGQKRNAEPTNTSQESSADAEDRARAGDSTSEEPQTGATPPTAPSSDSPPDQPASDDRNAPAESSTENETSGGPNRPSGQPTQPRPDEPRPGRPGLRRADSAPPANNAPSNNSTPGRSQTGTNQRADGSTGNLRGGNPITGDDFRTWSDRLRDVEELVSDSELRWEATQIRQAAREFRGEFKRHAADPQWDEVEDLVAKPLRNLKRKVADELIRRAAERSQMVPIDRDPVPAEFSRSVREYYENLGRGL